MPQFSTRQQIVYDNSESTRQYIAQDSPLSATAAGTLIRNIEPTGGPSL